MPAHLAPLRLWLLIAMLISAAVGLAAAVVLFGHIQESQEHASDLAKARQEARMIANQAQAGAGVARLAAMQDVLVNDQIVVTRGGATVFRGPVRRGRELELRATVSFPGGTVQIADYSSAEASTTLELALITAGVLALVILAAVGTATAVTRAVDGPVQRAIDAAERVSHGELSARMGASGPEELVKLGRAFDEMAARLESVDRDRRQFLADVAHEIATPINTVSGFALALAEGTASDPAHREEARALIEAETRRLRDLLTDLRQLTRLDLAEGLHLEPVRLAAFAEQLSTRFHPMAESAQVTLAVSAQRETVRTDTRLLEMIASNLVSNALRYTPAGGRVAVSIRTRRGELTLSVRDTGVGIAPEHQQMVFERLYRIDSTRDRATGGSGLGLAIAARAAHNLGGHIELESTPGQGSEFRLVLPAQPTPGDANGAPDAGQSPDPPDRVGSATSQSG